MERQARELNISVESFLSDQEAPLQLVACDLLLFDPYDFFERWPDWNELLLEAAREREVIVYLYNKSPRGVSQFRQYQSLRERWKGRPLHVGRVPADGLLPRAWHEVWLTGPEPARPELAEQLRRCTLDLHRHISEQGAWE